MPTYICAASGVLILVNQKDQLCEDGLAYLKVLLPLLIITCPQDCVFPAVADHLPGWFAGGSEKAGHLLPCVALCPSILVLVALSR